MRAVRRHLALVAMTLALAFMVGSAVLYQPTMTIACNLARTIGVEETCL